MQKKMNSLSGLLLVDKEAGITSHFVVSRVKRCLGADKVGHLGTLDPFASGLLPILIGNAARLSDDVMDGKKTYLFRVRLGIETDTLDDTGQIVKTAEVPRDFDQRAGQVLSQFLGEVEQVPPVYSALKMQGRPLYEHMRATGKLPQDIESKKRKVTIYELSMEGSRNETGFMEVSFRVTCGKGTYVRSLARDLALAIGTVGHCVALRREFVEPWHVRDGLVFGKESVLDPEVISSRMLSPFQMLPQVPVLHLNERFEKALSSGNPLLVPTQEFLEVDAKGNNNFESLFVTCKDIIYLAQVGDKTWDAVKVQPRKKISS